MTFHDCWMTSYDYHMIKWDLTLVEITLVEWCLIIKLDLTLVKKTLVEWCLTFVEWHLRKVEWCLTIVNDISRLLNDILRLSCEHSNSYTLRCFSQWLMMFHVSRSMNDVSHFTIHEWHLTFIDLHFMINDVSCFTIDEWSQRLTFI